MKKAVALMTSLVLCVVTVLQGSTVTGAASTRTQLPEGTIGIGLQSGEESTSLEAGSTVDVELRFDTAMEIGGVNAVFNYDSKYFEKVIYSDITLADPDQWEYGWDVSTSRINISPKSDVVSVTDPYLEAAGVLATIRLTVKEETDLTEFSFSDITVEERTQGYYGGTPISISIENAAADDRIFEVDIEDADIQARGLLELPVYATQNSGFNALSIEVNFDSTVFSYSGLELSGELKAYVTCQAITPSAGKVRVSLLSISGNVPVTGKLFTVQLQVSSGATIGNTYPITADIQSVNNYSLLPMNVGAQASADIRVTSMIRKGDVNMDGNIDLIDATFLLQYYNGIRELTSAQLAQGDVNGSGDITLIDVLMIMKYYNGENITFA